MKKIMMVIVLIILANESAHSQTELKPQPLSTLYFSGDSINFNNASIWSAKKQTRFQLGWQWSGPTRNVNERLHISLCFSANYLFTPTLCS